MRYAHAMSRYTALAAPFGAVAIVAGPAGLERVILTAGSPGEIIRRLGVKLDGAEHDPDTMPALQRQLRDYLAGKPVRFRAKIDLGGMTEFQRRVLDACGNIDHGHTVTYGELARRIGKPAAARAVGAALGRNPVPLVIPCHRIVGYNGSLGGFSAEQGISVKQWLLDLEARHANVT